MRIRHAVAAVVIPVVMSVAASSSFAGAFDSIERTVAKDVTRAEKVKEAGQVDKVIVVVVPEGANLASTVRAAVSKARRPEGEVARIPELKEFKPLANEAGQFAKRQVNDPRMSLRNP